MLGLPQDRKAESSLIDMLDKQKVTNLNVPCKALYKIFISSAGIYATASYEDWEMFNLIKLV